MTPFQNNLAAKPDQAERVKSLRAELEAWLKQQGDQRKVYGTPRLLGSGGS